MRCPYVARTPDARRGPKDVPAVRLHMRMADYMRTQRSGQRQTTPKVQLSATDKTVRQPWQPAA